MRKIVIATLITLLAISVSLSSSAQQQSGMPAPKQTTVYICPMHADVQSKTPGNCPKCEMKLVATTVVDAEEEFYACPMHPDVMGSKPDKCPRCGMALVKMAPPEAGEYEVRLETSPALVKP